MGPAHTLHGCVARFFFQVLESKRSHPPSGAVVSVQTLVCRRGRTTSPCLLPIVAEAADITLPIVAFLVLLFVFSVKPCVLEALRFAPSCVSVSVVQVLAPPWDTCVAVSGEFPVLILRTNPLVVIVYISSSGFFSLWLLLFSLCPSQCIESLCCPLPWPDYRLSCSLFFFII